MRFPTPRKPLRRRSFTVGRVVLGLVLLGNVSECRKAPQEQIPPRASSDLPRPAQSAPWRSPAIREAPYRFPAPGRLVAIGDLHGDLAAARAELELAGALDAKGGWKGGSLTVVQTGDILDRGDDEREILELFEQLAGEAARAGGAVYVLNGNHELLNVQGDFRYVTRDGIADFEDVSGGTSPAVRWRFPGRLRQRAAAFLPGGIWAKRLAAHPSVAVVGRTAFAHGGLSPGDVRYGLGRINGAVSAWMRGELETLPESVGDGNSPFWSRTYGEDQLPAEVCRTLDRVLEAIDADRLVVGHTPQAGGIASACGGKIWRIDVGLYQAHGSAPPQVLEIRGDRVEVLRPRPKQ